LPPDLCRRWLSVYPHIPLLNAYGPTECSDDVTHFPIHQPLAETQVHTPIGRPIENMRLYILDRHVQPLPVGVSGELYVGGVGVSRGYLHEPRRTAEAFVADPFSTQPGSRLYKTGDRTRYLPDGTIEFLGRLDYQVKIRGFRIELGEIEALLHQHPDVQDGVVIAREDTPHDTYLAAYVVASPTVTGSDLRRYLQEKLPEYMVPVAFVLLEDLPLTPNGKVDRRALPAPDAAAFVSTEYEAPQGEIEIALASIWSRLLKIERVSRHDNFFHLGGHSLLPVRTLTAIREALAVEISIRHVFAHQLLKELADRIVLADMETFDATELAALLASIY